MKFIFSYYIYELATSNVFPLSAREGDQNAPSLQYVLWAPRPQTTDGSSGNGERGSFQGIAFVQDGDIYYKPKVQSDLICRITTNGNICLQSFLFQYNLVIFSFLGKSDYMLNGVPDWLYSNVAELRSDSLSFSTDGQYLSYLSFNISNVHQYQ